MKHRAMIVTLVAALLIPAPSAFARNDKDKGNGNDNRNDRGRSEQSQRNNSPDRGDRNDRNNHSDRNIRPHESWRYSGRTYQFQGDDMRGAGPSHQFHRGERMPKEYHNKYYVVDDWRGHRLSAPPRGYHWVQAGGDYVLVAIATGIIVQLLLSN